MHLIGLLGLLGCAVAFGFNKGCLQCLAKPSSESSKRIGMSTMVGVFLEKTRGHERTTIRKDDYTTARKDDCTQERLHDCTTTRLYERTTTRLHERTMAQTEVHPYNTKQAYGSGNCNLEACLFWNEWWLCWVCCLAQPNSVGRTLFCSTGFQSGVDSFISDFNVPSL